MLVRSDPPLLVRSGPVGDVRSPGAALLAPTWCTSSAACRDRRRRAARRPSDLRGAIQAPEASWVVRPSLRSAAPPRALGRCPGSQEQRRSGRPGSFPPGPPRIRTCRFLHPAPRSMVSLRDDEVTHPLLFRQLRYPFEFR